MKQVDPDIKRQQIDNILDTPGWGHIEKIITDYIATVKDPAKIPNNIRNDIYAREVRAGVLAGKALEDILKTIKMSGATGKKASRYNYE